MLPFLLLGNVLYVMITCYHVVDQVYTTSATEIAIKKVEKEKGNVLIVGK